jgi:SseB protein N-terminal domain
MSSEGAGEDRGEADPALVAALAGGDARTIREAMLVSRLLVPVMALGAESDAAEMAVPRLVGTDGNGDGLPVFSSYEALRAWRPDARPVPMSGEQAVAGAMAEGYVAIVLDVAGPISHTVEFRPDR